MGRRHSSSTPPLPPRDGLGPSRVRMPDQESRTAGEFMSLVISTQRHRHPEDDERAIVARFEAGEVVLADGTPLSPDTVVTGGTDVFFYRTPAPEVTVPYEITTVYEDENILVVDKPPFLATMPRGAHITETATVRLRRATGNEELTPAHRLDRMTSGLLLLTKQAHLRGLYQNLFAQKQVRKRYSAIAEDRGVQTPQTWRHHIDKQHGEVTSTVIPDRLPNAQTELVSITPLQAPHLNQAYEVDYPLAEYLLEPLTGRTHQLRIQMNSAGVPILGDPFYPIVLPPDVEDFSKPMKLRSIYLSFVDPLTSEERVFTLPATQ